MTFCGVKHGILMKNWNTVSTVSKKYCHPVIEIFCINEVNRERLGRFVLTDDILFPIYPPFPCFFFSPTPVE